MLNFLPISICSKGFPARKIASNSRSKVEYLVCGDDSVDEKNSRNSGLPWRFYISTALTAVFHASVVSFIGNIGSENLRDVISERMLRIVSNASLAWFDQVI